METYPGLLLILMVLTSFAEMISIGAVLPFLAVLTSPERVFEHQASQSIIHILGLTSPNQLLLPLTIAFGLTAIIAGAMRLILLWASTRLSFATGSDLSISIYRRTLYQPYAVHVARNSSEIINGISGKASAIIYSTIFPVLTLASSSVMLAAILIALLTLLCSLADVPATLLGEANLIALKASQNIYILAFYTFVLILSAYFCLGICLEKYNALTDARRTTSNAK